MKNVSIEWKNGKPKGKIEIAYGKLDTISLMKCKGTISGESFAFSSHGSCRLNVAIKDCNLDLGSEATIVTVRTSLNPFSFFLRDVSKEYPILIPDYGVVVTDANDTRSYTQIENYIHKSELKTKLQRIQTEDEANYEEAAANTRKLHCPTWLGVSRDIRIFEVDFRGGRLDWIQPRFHGPLVSLPESNNSPVCYQFLIGRGIGCVENVSRSLEDGVLPILHGVIRDEDINYNIITFVTLEKSELNSKNLRGTHFMVADGNAFGHMFTEGQEKEFQKLQQEEMKRDEETVLFYRIEAINTSSVPRYAWFRNVHPTSSQPLKYSFDGDTGFGVYNASRVFCVTKINNKPLPQEEIAILLKPNESAVIDFCLPHCPVSKERALGLRQQNFEARHLECLKFWKQKLGSAAKVNLPEKRIDEMVRAGLLHLDLVSYGLEPEGTVAPTIGFYSPIGSESAPIIQFMDSMGWHNLARRSLNYFLDKQHEDGFMQNFDNYMLETGAALWSMGEHYRYTHDDKWIENILPKLLKSCEYIIRCRNLNKDEGLRGRGYGTIKGQVADPNDPYHQFMLNGYMYLGLNRVAEMISNIDPRQSRRLRQEAKELKKDTRTAFFEAKARSPIVPLGDGTWCPTAPPWAEGRGLMSLYADKGNWFSHLTFYCRDSLLGPLHLIFQEVIEPTEKAADHLVNCCVELMHERNVALSQPYYSQHPWVHLRRGEIKAFLKAYYHSLVSLSDRETYSFWEHYPGIGSPHKTHEEGWFLMQTRWMLWTELGETLKLLSGIPRDWMKNGKCLELKKVSSYFGPLSLVVESKLKQNRIAARIDCSSERQPKSIELRLPHPEGRKASKVIGGTYDSQTEIVKIEPFKNSAEVVLEF